jgi:Fe-S-cluster formation regulator IscX/YfhJ
VDLAQADVIARALDELPDDLDVETLRMAEERLVVEAETFDPRRLRILGRRILEAVAPDVAEDHARRALEDEEAHAEAVTFLRVRRRGDGTTDLHARLADAVAARLLTNLHAYTSPRQPGQRPTHEPAPADRRPYDRKLGHALGSLLEHLDPHRLPLHGGDATTVVVTVGLDDLQDQLQAAGLARVGDQPLTSSQARRLACTAKIVPAVLGRKSEVLDLGRSSRLFNPAQRKALALKHPTCAATGCTIPAPWCEAHHAGQPWSRGGRTNLTEGVLLCSHHHHRAHDPRYDTQHERDGVVSFHRRE